MRSFKEKKWVPVLFCFIVSFFILMFTSKCSFLYPMNDWVDANAFFTVGKGMMRGVVPYTDIFEQKGLFLYLIYGLGYLISHTSFIGIFIIEVLAFTVGLYFIYRIFALFDKEKYAFLFLPMLMALLCTAESFVHGGGAEELCFPFFAISLYYFLKHFQGDETGYRSLFLNGFLAGLILMTKYTLLGFWFAFMATIFFDLCFQKKWKKAFVSCIVFLSGMLIPFGIGVLYMAIFGNVKDMFYVYFYLNMTAYPRVALNFASMLTTFVGGYIGTLFNNGLLLFIAILGMPYIVCLLPFRKSGKLASIILYLFTILGIFVGLKFYKYYMFPVLIFAVFFFISLSFGLDKFFRKTQKKYLFYCSGVAVFIVSLFIAFTQSNYKEFRGVERDSLFQYQFKDIVLADDNPTLVNMGDLDCGLFTTTDLLPSTYFFELQNFNYDRFPDNIDAFHSYIENKTTNFIIYHTKMNYEKFEKEEPFLLEQYDLIRQVRQEFEHTTYYAYLLQAKKSS